MRRVSGGSVPTVNGSTSPPEAKALMKILDDQTLAALAAYFASRR
jgi:hypothetical protein